MEIIASVSLNFIFFFFFQIRLIFFTMLYSFFFSFFLQCSNSLIKRTNVLGFVSLF